MEKLTGATEYLTMEMVIAMNIIQLKANNSRFSPLRFL